MVDANGSLAQVSRRRPWIARVGVIIAMSAVSLMLASCGSTSPPHVANLGTTTTTGAVQGGGGNDLTRMISYAQCMRSHGVANYPDPLSDGEFDKTTVSQLASTNSHYQTANRSCSHLLPSGTNGMTPALAQEIYSDELKFVQCMHSHGVSNWPNPRLDRGRYDFDPEAVGIDTNSPQLKSKMQACDYVFPANIGVPPGAGHNP